VSWAKRNWKKISIAISLCLALSTISWVLYERRSLVGEYVALSGMMDTSYINDTFTGTEIGYINDTFGKRIAPVWSLYTSSFIRGEETYIICVRVGVNYVPYAYYMTYFSDTRYFYNYVTIDGFVGEIVGKSGIRYPTLNLIHIRVGK